MRAGSLTCEGCAGNIAIPQDPTLLAVACAYCGRQILLPDQEERRAALERAGEREREKQEKAQEALSERTARRRSVLLWTGAAVVFSGVIVFSILKSLKETGGETGRALIGTPSSAQSAEADRRRDAVGERLRKQITAAQIGSCGRVFAEPQVDEKTVDVRFTVGTHQCARFIATAAANDGVVKLTVKDAAGAVAASPRAGRDIDYLYCPRKLAGTHAAVFTTGGLLAAAGVECTRKMPTDPTGVGATRVASLLAAREAAGCRQILSAARTHPSEATLTARLERGACVQVIAATGMADNLLTASMMTPEGRPVRAPPPGLAVILSHCASRAGEHSGKITAALDGPFTTAAIICPRRAMPRELPPTAGMR